MQHISVLREEVGKCLNLKSGEVVIDATLGYGGHALEILKKIGKNALLIAFEQDERNLKAAKERLKDYNQQIIYFHENFRYLKSRVTEKVDQVDAILFDLGLSSPHVDDPQRGFSFMKEGPLDMRFDQRQKLTAKEVINTYPEDKLVEIFFKYGEEKMARKIADKVCQRRKLKPFETTLDLAQFLESILPRKFAKGQKAHPATKVFQALRIEVNDELTVLKETLEQAMEILKIGGRIVVISYHSLEDRIVKQFFKNLLQPAALQEELIYRNYGEPIVEAITKKPVIPTQKEIQENPRSRSAKLRAYKKLRSVAEQQVYGKGNLIS